MWAHGLSCLTPPYFLYNHIIAPHPPLNMTDDGALSADTFGMGDGYEREKMDAAWCGGDRSYFAPWSHPGQLTRIGRRDLADFGPMCTQSGFPAIGVTTPSHSYSLTRITPTTAINASGN
jgi:hypothetical protein